MRLKICDSHLTCKVANKCLNVRERVEVVEWNKKWSPPFPCCSVSHQCPWKKTLIEKNIAFLSTLDLINCELEINSRDKRKSHIYGEYTVVRTYFLCNDMCKNAWKTVFLKSGNGKAEDWRIVGNIFHLVLSYRMRKTLFVLSIMRVSERIGPNACVTRELHGTW